MKDTVYIWTEGGEGIGLGHVRRCLVIAQELQKEGMGVSFLINNDRPAVDWIKKEGFSYRIAKFGGNDLIDLPSDARRLILIDTKKHIAEMIKRLRLSDYRTTLIDNVTDARLEADVIIYPAAVFEDNLNWNGFKGMVFKGVDYVPIASSYRRAKTKVNHKELKTPYNVLVTMGGSDPNHLTHKVVSSLMELMEFVKIRVIIGPAFQQDEDLYKIEKQKYPHIEFIRGMEDLSQIMIESHIAVTALGTTIYELVYMGVPSIIIANYRTDEKDMIAFKKLGICLPIGYYEDVQDVVIRQAVEMFLKDDRLWSDMFQKGRTIIDGKGAERIATVVKKTFIDEL